MQKNEQEPTGGTRILRAMDFYRPIVNDIAGKTDQEMLDFSITDTLQTLLANKSEDEALELLADIEALAISATVLQEAIRVVGKAKYQKGASNVS